MNLFQEIVNAAPCMNAGESAVVVFNDSAKHHTVLPPQKHDNRKINRRLGNAWRLGERRYLVALFRDELYIYLDSHTILTAPDEPTIPATGAH